MDFGWDLSVYLFHRFGLVPLIRGSGRGGGVQKATQVAYLASCWASYSVMYSSWQLWPDVKTLRVVV